MATFVPGQADRASVRLAVAAGVCPLAGGRRDAVADLSPGGGVTCVSPKTAHDGDRLGAFTALGWVGAGAAFEASDRPGIGGFVAWVRPCRYAQPVREPELVAIAGLVLPEAAAGPCSAAAFRRIAEGMGVDPDG